jgi:hypothetical protein
MPRLAAAQGRPCAADVQRLCQSLTPERGAAVSCLALHRQELSADCRKYLERRERRRQAARERRRRHTPRPVRTPATPVVP